MPKEMKNKKKDSQQSEKESSQVAATRRSSRNKWTRVCESRRPTFNWMHCFQCGSEPCRQCTRSAELIIILLQSVHLLIYESLCFVDIVRLKSAHRSMDLFVAWIYLMWDKNLGLHWSEYRVYVVSFGTELLVNDILLLYFMLLTKFIKIFNLCYPLLSTDFMT